MNIVARPWEPQDLIDDLQMLIDEEPYNYLNFRRTTMCMARDYLKEHFAEPRWISVEEKLPEDEKYVLAYYGFNNDGDGDLGMMFIGTLCYFCFDPDPHWQHASHNLVVTHWMPMPEPPEVEG